MNFGFLTLFGQVTFDQSGQWTTYRNGQVIGPTNLNPTPDGSSWQIVADTYRSKGAVVYSSQWTGRVYHTLSLCFIEICPELRL